MPRSTRTEPTDAVTEHHGTCRSVVADTDRDIPCLSLDRTETEMSAPVLLP